MVCLQNFSRSWKDLFLWKILSERKSRIHIYMYSHSLVKTIYAYVSKVWRKIHSKVKKNFECFRCFFFTNFLNFPSGQLSFAYISLWLLCSSSTINWYSLILKSTLALPILKSYIWGWRGVGSNSLVGKIPSEFVVWYRGFRKRIHSPLPTFEN